MRPLPLLLVFTSICGGMLGTTTGLRAGQFEAIHLSSDGQSFVHAKSGQPFRVWGVNYDHDSQGTGRLLEDYWDNEWETVRSDFREMKELGANVVRIHLQFGRFMTTSDTPNEKALVQLRRLLSLAEETGLYLDLTGLGCYHQADVPPWYDAMNENDRWAAQASFWSAIAQTCRNSPAVFCYDLMNEPIVSGTRADGWLAGELAGKHFVQRLTLEAGSRSTIEIARQWTVRMTAAIRAEDREHLITVGAIPWAPTWPGAKSIFYSPEVSGALDFVSIHVYPKAGEIGRALEVLKTYDIGKPLLIEEMFPLSCSLEEMADFITRSRVQTAGYVSFYWGKTVDEYTHAAEQKDTAAVIAAWLKYFQQQAETMKGR